MLIFLTLLLLVVAGLGYPLIRHGQKIEKNAGRYEPDGFGWQVTGFIMIVVSVVVIGVIWIGGLLGVDNSQVEFYNKLDTVESDRAIAVEQQEQVKAVVITELNKYPEIEKQIIGNITPEIVLSFPELQSNQTITDAANKLKESQDAIFRRDYERNEILRQILNNETLMNIRTPFFVTYEDRYGEPNPLTVGD